MKVIGCDFHPRYQQFAMVDEETGELMESRLEHEKGQARRFYEALPGQPVRVGIEAVGNSQWFEKLLEDLGHELWIGDAARIRRLVVREQKTDRRDDCGRRAVARRQRRNRWRRRLGLVPH